MSRLEQVIDALEAERDEVRQHLAWIEQQIAEFRKRHAKGYGRSTTTRASRSAGASRTAAARPASTARRTRTRTTRSTSRPQRGETKTKIIEYLKANPGSTASEISGAVGLKRNSTSTRLAQMARAGEIKKAKRGYEAR